MLDTESSCQNCVSLSVRQPGRGRLPGVSVDVARKQPGLSVRRAPGRNEHLPVNHRSLGSVLRVVGVLSRSHDDCARLRRCTVLQYLSSAAEHNSRQHQEGQY